MPSNNKTLFLRLNKWLGSDKPKKDDFNSDNQIIDDAYNSLYNDVTTLGTSISGKASAQSVTDLGTAISTHTANESRHVTASDRELWSSNAGMVFGYYHGSNEANQKITLGFQAKLVLVYEVGKGIVRLNWDSDGILSNSGFISSMGATKGLALNSDGFTVSQSTTIAMDGYSSRFNESGSKYAYVAWR